MAVRQYARDPAPLQAKTTERSCGLVWARNRSAPPPIRAAMTIVMLAAILLAIWLFLWGITTPKERRYLEIDIGSGPMEIECEPSSTPAPRFEPAPEPAGFHVEADTQTGYCGGWCSDDD
jgi:hypothetical protein